MSSSAPVFRAFKTSESSFNFSETAIKDLMLKIHQKFNLNSQKKWSGYSEYVGLLKSDILEIITSPPSPFVNETFSENFTNSERCLQ